MHTHVFMKVTLFSFKYIPLYINELGLLLILYQYLIIRIFLITDNGNLANFNIISLVPCVLIFSTVMIP